MWTRRGGARRGVTLQAGEVRTILTAVPEWPPPRPPAPHRHGAEVRVPDRALAKQQAVGDGLGDGERLAAGAIGQHDDREPPPWEAQDGVAEPARLAGVAPGCVAAIARPERAASVVRVRAQRQLRVL